MSLRSWGMTTERDLEEGDWDPTHLFGLTLQGKTWVYHWGFIPRSSQVAYFYCNEYTTAVMHAIGGYRRW